MGGLGFVVVDERIKQHEVDHTGRRLNDASEFGKLEGAALSTAHPRVVEFIYKRLKN